MLLLFVHVTRWHSFPVSIIKDFKINKRNGKDMYVRCVCWIKNTFDGLHKSKPHPK